MGEPHIFGPRAAETIANIKYNRDLLDAAVARLDQTKGYKYTWFAIPAEVSAVIRATKEIVTFIEDLLASLP